MFEVGEFIVMHSAATPPGSGNGSLVVIILFIMVLCFHFGLSTANGTAKKKNHLPN